MNKQTVQAARDAKPQDRSDVSVADGEYIVDVDRTRLTFRAKAFCLTWVSGTLRARSGQIRAQGGTISGRGTADAASVDTRLTIRNWHLRTKHYLHAKRHPEVQLGVEVATIAATEVFADLTVRERDVRFPIRIDHVEAAGDKLTVNLSGTFDRRGLGMLPRFMGVSRLVHLDLEIVAKRRPD
jgi:polyisoprenoid-binding protein YceI